MKEFKVSGAQRAFVDGHIKNNFQNNIVMSTLGPAVTFKPEQSKKIKRKVAPKLLVWKLFFYYHITSGTHLRGLSEQAWHQMCINMLAAAALRVMVLHILAWHTGVFVASE